MLLFNRVGFALSVGMALIVVLFGFTLLSAAGLVGFAATDTVDATASPAIAADTVFSCRGADFPNEATLISSLTPTEAAEIAAGDALFKGNCAQCHAVNEQVVGPALAGITKRRPVSWLLPWVKNSSKLVASGDEYAVAIYAKYNKQQMPSFALSDKEIGSILAYVKSQEGNSVSAVASAR